MPRVRPVVKRPDLETILSQQDDAVISLITKYKSRLASGDLKASVSRKGGLSDEEVADIDRIYQYCIDSCSGKAETTLSCMNDFSEYNIISEKYKPFILKLLFEYCLSYEMDIKLIAWKGLRIWCDNNWMEENSHETSKLVTLADDIIQRNLIDHNDLSAAKTQLGHLAVQSIAGLAEVDSIPTFVEKLSELMYDLCQTSRNMKIISDAVRALGAFAERIPQDSIDKIIQLLVNLHRSHCKKPHFATNFVVWALGHLVQFQRDLSTDLIDEVINIIVKHPERDNSDRINKGNGMINILENRDLVNKIYSDQMAMMKNCAKNLKNKQNSDIKRSGSKIMFLLNQNWKMVTKKSRPSKSLPVDDIPSQNSADNSVTSSLDSAISHDHTVAISPPCNESSSSLGMKASDQSDLISILTVFEGSTNETIGTLLRQLLANQSDTLAIPVINVISNIIRATSNQSSLFLSLTKASSSGNDSAKLLAVKNLTELILERESMADLDTDAMASIISTLSQSIPHEDIDIRRKVIQALARVLSSLKSSCPALFDNIVEAVQRLANIFESENESESLFWASYGLVYGMYAMKDSTHCQMESFDKSFDSASNYLVNACNDSVSLKLYAIEGLCISYLAASPDWHLNETVENIVLKTLETQKDWMPSDGSRNVNGKHPQYLSLRLQECYRKILAQFASTDEPKSQVSHCILLSYVSESFPRYLYTGLRRVIEDSSVILRSNTCINI